MNPILLWIILGTFAALAAGTCVRLVALRRSKADVAKKRIDSLKVWWVLFALWSLAAISGQIGVTLFLSAASLLAMREYLRLLGPREQLGTAAICCLVLVSGAHYLWILFGYIEVAKWFLPVVGIVLLGAARAPTCSPQGYVRTTAGLYWGAMLMIYAFSHALFLFEVESGGKPLVGRVGWILYLVLLTEMNDIMQAVVGRKFGKTKITPRVSPNKSLQGLIGGLITTIALSVTVAPLLTTLTAARGVAAGVAVSTLAGIVISLSGFLGDINMSAIKRDAGVKDGSTMLPGMGGMIDRIDSLTFTAPVFYYFVVLTTYAS